MGTMGSAGPRPAAIGNLARGQSWSPAPWKGTRQLGSVSRHGSWRQNAPASVFVAAARLFLYSATIEGDMKEFDMSLNFGKRLMVSVGAGVLILGASVAPAYASVTEDGTKICGGSTPFAYLQLKTKGDRVVLAPGKSSATWQAGSSSWYTNTRQGSGSGGFWSVTGDITVDLAYTKGICKNFSS